jgi:hypothetical protein
MVVAAVPTFAGVPFADGYTIVEPTAALASDRNAVMEPPAALAADGNAVLEPTAALEATTAAMRAAAAALEATTAALEATAAALEVTTAAIEATAAPIEAPAAVKAAATTATASGICRAGQNHRATHHGSACGEFPHKVHGCRNSTPQACSITFVAEEDWSAGIREKARLSVGDGQAVEGRQMIPAQMGMSLSAATGPRRSRGWRSLAESNRSLHRERVAS